ncbi:hypothetical protein [Pseudomonas violetae]|uniref:Uncharacterized protein n=1 Tax=Pseudomonas violetae TaxID=2915813 RepID=A0ABT0F1W1_9PSED|nr:hypothetical protein [Pseudomonas violetae]MCK1791652.1 hypothetical protein [Pseudomonas violetae]
MLDRTKTEPFSVETNEFEWRDLSTIERRLIRLYRLLNEQEQIQLRRMSQVLATNPKSPRAADFNR